MFPVGIPPQAADENRDERGLDTINRLLLHGARYHHRPHLFVARGGVDGGRDVPDWEADRLSIRIGLALHEELLLQPGDSAALFMPLSISWALVERGLWGLGATSVPVPPDLRDSDVSDVLARVRPKILFVSSAERATPLSIPDSVAAVVTLDESAKGGFGLALKELLDRGGVLDTPERASRFRATARTIPPEALASLEVSSPETLVETTQGSWARAAERFARRIPPRPGERHLLSSSGVEQATRIVLYGRWADGLTTVVFSEGASGTAPAYFANLFPT